MTARKGRTSRARLARGVVLACANRRPPLTIRAGARGHRLVHYRAHRTRNEIVTAVRYMPSGDVQVIHKEARCAPSRPSEGAVREAGLCESDVTMMVAAADACRTYQVRSGNWSPLSTRGPGARRSWTTCRLSCLAIGRLAVNQAVWSSPADGSATTYAAARVSPFVETLRCLLATDTDDFIAVYALTAGLHTGDVPTGREGWLRHTPTDRRCARFSPYTGRPRRPTGLDILTHGRSSLEHSSLS
jgi:hypothetical protein